MSEETEAAVARAVDSLGRPARPLEQSERITLRLSSDLVEGLDQVRSVRRLSRSKVAREALAVGLEALLARLPGVRTAEDNELMSETFDQLGEVERLVRRVVANEGQIIGNADMDTPQARDLVDTTERNLEGWRQVRNGLEEVAQSLSALPDGALSKEAVSAVQETLSKLTRLGGLVGEVAKLQHQTLLVINKGDPLSDVEITRAKKIEHAITTYIGKLTQMKDALTFEGGG